MKVPQNVSESVRKLNPSLYPVGAVGGVVRESGPKPALVKDVPRKQGRKRGVVVVVSIVSYRHRLVDDDNSCSGGNKALRDAIAKSLGVDDADKRVRWCYGQVRTDGYEGTVVTIESL